MLKISQVAERLNCSIQNVHNMIQRGRIAAFRVGANGKAYRISEAQLEAFMTERSRHPGKEAGAFSPKTKPKAKQTRQCEWF